MKLRLVKLGPEHREQLFDMMDEWTAAEQDFCPYIIRRADYHDFENYVRGLEEHSADGWDIPNSVYFCLDEERDCFVGAVDIRHRLNDWLRISGGHIGTGIRPSERRRGLGTAMVGLALEKCRELGITQVLMTCEKDNIGSARSIVKNGGRLTEEFVNQDGRTEQRYQIDLTER